MPKYILLLLTTVIIGCNSDNKKSDSNQLSESNPRSVTNPKLIEDDSWKHKSYFNFNNYKEYKLSDTIEIDLNQNGVKESIYFKTDSCRKLIISENGFEDIILGCSKQHSNGIPNQIEWVDLWCVVFDKETDEVIVSKKEGIMGDRTITLEGPSIFIGEEEAGGGIITYRDGELNWVHQSD